MKFVFKMFILVGMILVGKFLKEDSTATSAIDKKENTIVGDHYSLRSESPLPFTQQTKNGQAIDQLKPETTEKTYTYSFN